MSETERKGASPGPWRWAGLSGDLVAANNETVMQSGEVFLAADAALIASAPEMASLLRELEWAGSVDDAPCCPICAVPIRFGEGHAPDCRLSALLTRIGR